MKVDLDKKGNLKLSKKDAMEMAENMAEELFKKNELLDDAYPFIPDKVRDCMVELEPRKMELAAKRYEKRLKKEDKIKEEFSKLMQKRNRAVHMPLPEYEEMLANQIANNVPFTEDQKHLRFVKEGLMSALFSIVTAWIADLNEAADVYRVQERHFGEREEKIKKGEKLTDEERFGTLKFEVQKDGTKMPVMEDKVMLPIEGIKTPEFYSYYIGEILERLVRENVTGYKEELNKTGITKEYEEESRKLQAEFDKLQ